MIPLADVDIRARFGNARPGRKLVAIEQAALPVTVMRVLVSAQEEKPLALVDEFLIRSVHAGLSDIASIAALLGLGVDNLSDSLVTHILAGNLIYDESAGQIEMTTRGRVTAEEMISVAPIEREIPVCFDRSIWRAVEYHERDLISRHEAVDSGMILMPAVRSQHVERSDLRLPDLEQLVKSGKGHKLQLLSVIRARATKHRYLPVRLLVFSAGVNDRPELLVLVEGEESFSHGERVDATGGATGFRLSLRWKSADLLPPAPDVGDEATIAILAPLDHPLHLTEALTTAKERIFIVADSLRRSIVGRQFLSLLEQRLRDDVQVRVLLRSFGAAGVQRPVQDQLTELARRFSNLEFGEAPQAPRLLMYDSITVRSGFDWLGYRGGDPREYFAADGELIHSSQYADRLFRALARSSV